MATKTATKKPRKRVVNQKTPFKPGPDEILFNKYLKEKGYCENDFSEIMLAQMTHDFIKKFIGIETSTLTTFKKDGSLNDPITFNKNTQFPDFLYIDEINQIVFTSELCNSTGSWDSDHSEQMIRKPFHLSCLYKDYQIISIAFSNKDYDETALRIFEVANGHSNISVYAARFTLTLPQRKNDSGIIQYSWQNEFTQKKINRDLINDRMELYMRFSGLPESDIKINKHGRFEFSDKLNLFSHKGNNETLQLELTDGAMILAEEHGFDKDIIRLFESSANQELGIYFDTSKRKFRKGELSKPYAKFNHKIEHKDSRIMNLIEKVSEVFSNNGVPVTISESTHTYQD
jgi:hypothetical protein